MDVVLALARRRSSIGAFLRHRLGGAMVDRARNRLLGGIYGARSTSYGSSSRSSRSSRDYERDHRSLLFASLAQGPAARARATAGGSGSPQPPSGMGSLVDALADAVRAAPAAEIRLGTSVVALERAGARTAVTLSDEHASHPMPSSWPAPSASPGRSPRLRPRSGDPARLDRRRDLRLPGGSPAGAARRPRVA